MSKKSKSPKQSPKPVRSLSDMKVVAELPARRVVQSPTLLRLQEIAKSNPGKFVLVSTHPSTKQAAGAAKVIRKNRTKGFEAVSRLIEPGKFGTFARFVGNGKAKTAKELLNVASPDAAAKATAPIKASKPAAKKTAPKPAAKKVKAKVARKAHSKPAPAAPVAAPRTGQAEKYIEFVSEPDPEVEIPVDALADDDAELLEGAEASE